MTPIRTFLRHFREALSRASVSVGGVSICFDAPRDRPESRLRKGWIEAQDRAGRVDAVRSAKECASAYGPAGGRTTP